MTSLQERPSKENIAEIFNCHWGRKGGICPILGIQRRCEGAIREGKHLAIRPKTMVQPEDLVLIRENEERGYLKKVYVAMTKGAIRPEDFPGIG